MIRVLLHIEDMLASAHFFDNLDVDRVHAARDIYDDIDGTSMSPDDIVLTAHRLYERFVLPTLVEYPDDLEDVALTAHQRELFWWHDGIIDLTRVNGDVSSRRNGHGEDGGGSLHAIIINGREQGHFWGYHDVILS